MLKVRFVLITVHYFIDKLHIFRFFLGEITQHPFYLMIVNRLRQSLWKVRKFARFCYNFFATQFCPMDVQ